jgi:tetratricopeptide (TPR) repeat protein
MQKTLQKRKEQTKKKKPAKTLKQSFGTAIRDPRSLDWKRLAARFVPYILIFIAGFALYSHSVDYPLENLDENVIIGSNLPFISDFSNVKAAFMRDAFFSTHGKEFYRPLQNISYMVDAQIGKGKPSGFRFMTIFLHCVACCVLLFFLRGLKFGAILSAFFAIGYALHPLFTHVAVWVPSRGDILLAIFGVLTFFFFLKYSQTGNRLYAFLHIAAYACSVFSKETSIIFPFIIIGYYFIVRPRRRPSVLLIPLLGEGLLIGLYLLLRNAVVKAATSGQIFGIGPLFSNLATIPETMEKYLLPIHNLSPLATYSTMTTSLGLFFILLLAVALYLTRKRGIPTDQIVFFTFWFLILLVPGMMYRHELSTKAYDYLEHRAYFPLMGIVVIACHLVRVFPWKRALLPAGVLYLFWLGYSAYGHSMDYRNVIAFYDAVIQSNPENSLAYNDRGIAKTKLGDYAGALKDYAASIRTAPQYAKPINNRGNLWYKNNKFDSAFADYNEAIRRSPAFAEPYNGRGVIEYMWRQYDNAIKDFDKAISLDNSYADAYNSRASVKAAIADRDGAIRDYETAIRLKPDYAVAIENLKRVRAFSIGGTVRSGTESPTTRANEHNQAGVNKGRAGDYLGALKEFSEAIKLNPNDGAAYTNRGNTKQALHDREGALRDWKKGADLGNQDAKETLKRMSGK